MTVPAAAVERHGLRPYAVVFDIDGVLADSAAAIVEEIAKPVPDWATHYIEQAPGYAPTEGWPTLVRLLYGLGVQIVLLTGRPDTAREMTEAWLGEHDIPFTELLMRPAGHAFREFKGPTMVALKERYEVVLAVDDEDAHLVHFRDLGVPCLRVHTGLDTIGPSDYSHLEVPHA